MIQIIKRDKQVSNELLNRLAKKHKTTKEIVALLLNRGYNETDLDLYIQNDGFYTAPFNSIKNVDEAAETIVSYLEDDKAEIYIFADDDADGVNAGYVMTDSLMAVKESIESKCKVSVYYPNRCEGYGLSMSFCKALVPRKTKKRILVITVDNGITKKEEVAYLQSKGVEVIITDHHAPKAGHTPECLVVDPWLNDLDSINAKGLCGTAVAYKIAGRVLEMYGDNTFIMNYLPNVAIATITDMMPATPENIGLVGYGLWLIDNGCANEGIKHYISYKNLKEITVKDIAFEIGPQINACGRMGNIHKATDFMFGNGDVEEIYNEMIALNDSRKALEKEIMESIAKQADNYKNDLMVIIHVPNLGGLGGTVASKVVEMFGKPCILLSGEGEDLHGSARTYGGLDLLAIFTYEVKKGNLKDFGGHKVAAGVTVEKSKLELLRQSINSTLAQLFIETNEEVEEDVTIEVDEIISLADIKKNTIQPYEGLLCFGDLKEPVFALTDVEVLEARSSSNNANHLCLNLQDNTCIGTKNRYGKVVGKELWIWNKMPDYKRLGEPKKVHLLGKIVPDFRNPRFYTFDVTNIIPA